MISESMSVSTSALSTSPQRVALPSSHRVVGDGVHQSRLIREQPDSGCLPGFLRRFRLLCHLMNDAFDKPQAFRNREPPNHGK